MKLMTLILCEKNGEKRNEYTLFMCSRVSLRYLNDLYALYTGKATRAMVPNSTVQSVATLTVHEMIDPELWLNCVRWTRYRHVGEFASMEIFVVRPTRSGFYYAVGEDGTLLVNHDRVNDTIEIHKETVDVWSGTSKEYCKKPTMIVVDKLT